MPLACYIAAAAILSVVCILPLREAAGAPLGPMEPGADEVADMALQSGPV